MGAFETSWFHAAWFAADGAVAGPVKAGKIGQPPTRGGFAAAAGDAMSPGARRTPSAATRPTDARTPPRLMPCLSAPGRIRLTPRVPRMSTSDRLAAWLVTGPVGRVVAFFCDLSVALARWAINKLSRR